MSFRRRLIKKASDWLRVVGLRRRKPGLLPSREQGLVAAIRAKNLTYLSEAKLAALVDSCRAIEEMHIPGLVVEAGCALGGSTILIASLKSLSRPMRVYDVFGMIPSPTEQDTDEVHSRYAVIRSGESKGIGGDEYYGYRQDLYDIVNLNLAAFSIDPSVHQVELIRGLIEDTMHIDQSVAFAHIDVDWYEPVKTSLHRIVPWLAVGGILILDDYHDWGGCRKATDEYFSRVSGEFLLDDSAGSMKVTRIGRTDSGR